jgi:hypothetical protein
VIKRPERASTSVFRVEKAGGNSHGPQAKLGFQGCCRLIKPTGI